VKILIVNVTDCNSGAAIASYRLHKALLKYNIDSTMLVQNKVKDDYTLVGPVTKVQKLIGLIRPTLDSLPLIIYKNKLKVPFSVSWLPFGNIVKIINTINPDIVHLHWICGGMIKIEDINKIKSPIVWSLHDNWAFTGGCHVKWDCEKYKDSCGACPIIGSSSENDISRKIFKKKEKSFKKINNITIIGLSKWLTECSRNSALMKDKKNINIPNLIDTNVFKKYDKMISRDLWGLPKNRDLLLFGAISTTSDVNKGFKELKESLGKLKNQNIEVVVLGSYKPEIDENLGFKIHYLGSLYDEVSIVTVYSAADVVLVPSIQENLSNTIMESMSCSTPVVGFDVGGNSDMIEHKQNGYLAKPFDTTDFKDGIEWVLNSDNYDGLCEKARNKITRNFDSAVVVKRYVKLYQDILD
jgi:glycosyltransferase involved in cell wall biosynthesis